MRYTLLELTQNILSSLDGDEVNSITDTTESLQVVKCIETTYWDIISRGEFPRNFTFFSLTPSGDPLKPTLMYLPDTQLTLSWVRYNRELPVDPSPNFSNVEFQDLDTFLQRMYALDSTDTAVTEYDHQFPNGATMTFLSRNDRHPTYYTTPDDQSVIFDSYDNTVDTTLQESKTMCYGEKLPTFTETDNFVADLPAKQFSLLLNEAKALAWAELKQAQNAKAEQRARKGWISSQKSKRNIDNPRNELDRLPNYGRK